MRLKNVTIPEESDGKTPSTFSIARKKVRVKNLSFGTEGNYEQAVFPILTEKKHKVRIKNATNFKTEIEKYQHAKFPIKDDETQSIKQEAGTVNKQEDNMSEAEIVASNFKKIQPKRTKGNSSSYVFKSKRLQELQIRKDGEDQNKEEKAKLLSMESTIRNDDEKNMLSTEDIKLMNDKTACDSISIASECKLVENSLSGLRKRVSVDSDHESVTSSKSSTSCITKKRKNAKALTQKRKLHEVSESDRESVTSSKSETSLISGGKRHRKAKLQSTHQRNRSRVQQLKQQDQKVTEVLSL